MTERPPDDKTTDNALPARLPGDAKASQDTFEDSDSEMSGTDRDSGSNSPATHSVKDSTDGTRASGFTTPGKQTRGRETSLPDRIGRYETISRLGEGSFGIVLKSLDPNLNRPVAVKLQKIRRAGSNTRVDRFLSEARAAARLRHPHIIPVYEFGEFAGNQFIVYEFIDGQTLDEWVASCTPDIQSRTRMVARVAGALDYAHSLGIVHRDIKPANLLVDSEHGLPHIADFGCAKHEQPHSDGTVDGSMVGTPAFMSPEVVAGRANQADGRADVWALGVVLYELLTGERPFQGSISELFHKIQNVEPRRPRQIASDIPRDLETIILKCLEKDASRRFESCGQLENDLHRWLNGMPVESRRTGVGERTWLWARRNPAMATLLGLVTSCLILIAVGSVLFAVSLHRQKNELVQRRVDALATASPSFLPAIVEDLAKLDATRATSQIRLILEDDVADDVALACHLALFGIARQTGEWDEDALQGILAHVETATPNQLKIMLTMSGDGLVHHNTTLWRIASKGNMQASCVVAHTGTSNLWRWNNEQGEFVISFLLSEPSARISQWSQLLKPVSEQLRPGLEKLFGSSEFTVRDRSAEIMSWMYEDNVEMLVQLGLRARPHQLKWFHRILQGDAARKLMNKRITGAFSLQERNQWLLMSALGSRGEEIVETLFAKPATESVSVVRNRLINNCASAGINVDALSRYIADFPGTEIDHESSELAAVILAIGGYDQRQFFQTRREDLKEPLLDLFRHHKDVAVHSACRWLLNRWGFTTDLDSCVEAIQTAAPKPGYSWHEDTMGICFAVFEPVASFHIGPGDSYAHKIYDNMNPRRVSIPRRFGIAIHETTRGQSAEWESRLNMNWSNKMVSESDGKETWGPRIRWLNAAQKNRRGTGDPKTPVTNITWDEVALFCNELSGFAGMGDEDFVYDLKFGTHTWTATDADDALDRPGYRMPTATEWEYASRAMSTTRFFFGDSTDSFAAYGWSVNNSGDRLMPIGSLKPNDFGLFDCHGNATEWCHNIMIDKGIAGWQDVPRENLPREVRDQSCAEETGDITVFYRSAVPAINGHHRRGMRLARTYSSNVQSHEKKELSEDH